MSVTGLQLPPFHLPAASQLRCLAASFAWAPSGAATVLTKKGTFSPRLWFHLGQWAAVAYPAAAWGPGPSVGQPWDCTLGVPYSAVTGHWISVCGPGGFLFDIRWEQGTKRGCNHSQWRTWNSSIGRSFSVPISNHPCMKSAVSILLTHCVWAWKEIQTGFYFTQHQNVKSSRLTGRKKKKKTPVCNVVEMNCFL